MLEFDLANDIKTAHMTYRWTRTRIPFATDLTDLKNNELDLSYLSFGTDAQS